MGFEDKIGESVIGDGEDADIEAALDGAEEVNQAFVRAGIGEEERFVLLGGFGGRGVLKKDLDDIGEPAEDVAVVWMAEGFLGVSEALIAKALDLLGGGRGFLKHLAQGGSFITGELFIFKALLEKQRKVLLVH